MLGFKDREHGDNFTFESIYSTKSKKNFIKKRPKHDSDCRNLILEFEIAHCTGNMPCTTIHFNDELQWEYVEWESAMKKGKWL